MKRELIGIPQGLPISAILANIYMLRFDEYLLDKLVINEGCFYRRYSDDIVIVCEEEQVEMVLNTIGKEITKYDLSIAPEKTEKTLFKEEKVGTTTRLQCFNIEDKVNPKFNQPFNYLGFEFYGYLTLIKSKNLASFYREMKDIIRRKAKRVEKIKNKSQIDSAPIFKREVYRLYSFKGAKTGRKRKLGTNKISNRSGKEIKRKYKGNFIRYAYKASEIMDAPEIKRQINDHWKILQKTLKKHNFSN